MTTTPEQIAKQIVYDALGPCGMLLGTRERAAQNSVDRLRAAGLLVGDSTEEQIERAAAERWPALHPDDEELTYPRSALRDFCRDAFVEGARFAAAGPASSASAVPDVADQHGDAEEGEAGGEDHAATVAGVPQVGLVDRLREILTRDDEDDARAGEYINPEARRLQIANRTIGRIEAALDQLAPQEPSEEQIDRAVAVLYESVDEHVCYTWDEYAEAFPAPAQALRSEARQVLAAAASVAQQEPSGIEYQCSGCAGISEGCDPVIHAKSKTAPSLDHEKLIAEAESWPEPEGPMPAAAPADLIRRLAAALAAPPMLDEAKLGEVIWCEQSSRLRDGYLVHTRETARSTARAVIEALRGAGR